MSDTNTVLLSLRFDDFEKSYHCLSPTRPLVPGNLSTLKTRVSGADISSFRDYLIAGNCAAAIASRFSEFSAVACPFPSSSSQTGVTLEAKLAELANLEEWERKKAQVALVEKENKVRRFMANNWSGSNEGDLMPVNRLEKHSLSYSLALHQNLLDLRIELARMDVEIGNIALKGAANKVRYASDYAMNPKMFKPACPDDTDLFDFMALGEVREEDILIRHIVTQRSDSDRKSTRLNSSHSGESRMPSSA